MPPTGEHGRAVLAVHPSQALSRAAGLVFLMQGPGLLRKVGDVASNLACIGLAVSNQAELAQLIKAVFRSVHEVGVYDGVHGFDSPEGVAASGHEKCGCAVS